MTIELSINTAQSLLNILNYSNIILLIFSAFTILSLLEKINTKRVTISLTIITLTFFSFASYSHIKNEEEKYLAAKSRYDSSLQAEKAKKESLKKYSIK